MDEEQIEVEANTADYETNTDSEGEAQAEGRSEESDTDSERTYTQAEVDERVKEQDKRWKDRIKKSGKGSEESSEKGKKEEVDERFTRLDMKTEGVTSKKEQDIVLDYIREKKLLGKEVEVSEALKSMVVKEELALIRKKDSVPTPSTRTSTQSSEPSLDHYAKLMSKGRTREVPLQAQREIRKKKMIKW